MGNYIGADPARMRDTQNRVSYTAAADQTTFAAIYTPGYIDFYQNGIKLQEGVDFTANTGTTAVLTTPAFLGDTIEIVCISSSSPWNFYTKAQADIRADNFYGVAAGSGDAMTTSLTPTPTALFDGMEIKIRVPAVNSITAPSLTIMGLGVSKTIFTAGGQALSAGAYAAGQEITLRYNITADRFELTAGALVYGSTPPLGSRDKRLVTSEFITASKIISIGATVDSSALTCTLDPVTLDFRSATLSSGSVSTVAVNTQLSLVIPTSATLGSTSALPSKLVLLGLLYNGAVELAIVNIMGSNQLDETNLISTTAINAGATSNSVIYSAGARSNVPYRVLGYIESTQATAGTWVTPPSAVQGCGGEALSVMGSIGYGQTWQIFTSGTRAIGTTYYNTTGRPITVICGTTNDGSANSYGHRFAVNDVNVAVNFPAASNTNAPNNNCSFTSIVIPAGGSYRANGGSWSQWSELR